GRSRTSSTSAISPRSSTPWASSCRLPRSRGSRTTSARGRSSWPAGKRRTKTGAARPGATRRRTSGASRERAGPVRARPGAERSASRHRIEDLLRLTGTFGGGRRGGGLLSRVRSFALPLLDRAPERDRLFADLERLDARAGDLRRDSEALFTRLAVEPAASDERS